MIITVDEENSAESFWDSVAAAAANGNPIAQRFNDKAGPWEMTAAEWEEARGYLATLDGWTGGPSYAPHPVVAQ